MDMCGIGIANMHPASVYRRATGTCLVTVFNCHHHVLGLARTQSKSHICLIPLSVDGGRVELARDAFLESAAILEILVVCIKADYVFHGVPGIDADRFAR